MFFALENSLKKNKQTNPKIKSVIVSCVLKLFYSVYVWTTCAAPNGGTLSLFMALCLSPPSSSVVTSAWKKIVSHKHSITTTNTTIRQLHRITMFYLSLRYELCDLFAGIKWSNFNMGNSPVSPPWCFQNLIMLLQNLPETCEIQVLNKGKGNIFNSRTKVVWMCVKTNNVNP